MCKISSAALGKGLLTSLLLVLALFSPLKAQNAPAPTIIVNQVILAENSILGQVDGDWILHATPFFKAAGAEVSIQNQSLHANWTNASLVLTVGQASCLFNNKTYPLSVPPALDQNDLVVKLYEISQIIGATITPQDSRLCVQCTLMSNRVLRTTPLPGPTPLNPTQSAMQSYLANFSTSGGQIPGLGATNYNPLDTSPYTTYQSAYPTSSAQLPPAPPPVLGTAPVGNPPLAAQSATVAPVSPEAAPTAPGAPASEGSLAPAYQTTPPGAAPGTTVGTNFHLPVGTHKVSYEIKAGWDGSSVVLSYNGQAIQNNSTITVTADMTEFTLSATGAINSTGVSDNTGAAADDGMGLTDYLLIILVVLIVVMAIMVALRLMRS